MNVELLKALIAFVPVSMLAVGSVALFIQGRNLQSSLQLLGSSSRQLNTNYYTRRHVMRSESCESVWTPKGVIGQPDMEHSAEPNHKPSAPPENRPARSFKKWHHC